MRTRPCATTLQPELAPEELIALEGTLRGANLSGTHLEVGTAAGGSLCALMSLYTDAARPPFVVVDPMTYFDNQLETVRKNLLNHGLPTTGVTFRVTYSNLACAQAEKEGDQFDFMFIDGNHKIRYVTQDISWTRLLNRGGIVCFHDYEEKSPGVVLPVDRFLKRNPNYKILSRTRSLLILLKTEMSANPEISRVDHLWAAAISPWLQLRASLAKRRRRQVAASHA